MSLQYLDTAPVYEIIQAAEACYPTDRRPVFVLPELSEGEELTSRDPRYDQLLDRLHALTDEQLMELRALMWLGRGNGGETANNWPDVLRQAEEQVDQHSPHYLADKPPLGQYLRAGLERLGLYEPWCDVS